MQPLDIHLSDLAPWRALLTKAQFVANIEFHSRVEEYLLGIVYRANARSYLEACERQQVEYAATDDPVEMLQQFGDQCLVAAGLYPETVTAQGLALAQLVEMGSAAYKDYASHTQDPLFEVLGELFVEIVDVLHTLREVECGESALDPINAYQLWQATGSAHAWGVLQNSTTALPSGECSDTRH